MKNKPTEKLRIYLIESEYSDKEFKSFLTDPLDSNNEYLLKNEYEFEGAVYVKQGVLKPPKWCSLINEGVSTKIQDLKTGSCSGVMFIKVEGRIFLFTFGHARFMVDSRYFVTDFGIKTALNCIKSDSLRSVDMFSIDEQAVQKRVQTTNTTDINVFGMDVSKDILRAVTGEPKAGVRFKTITGGDSVFSFSCKMEFEDIFEIAKEIYELYKSDCYKSDFSWIDNIRKIKDLSEINLLNDEVCELIRNRDSEIISLTVPDIIDWSEVDGFSYIRAKGDIKPCLDINDYYRGLADDKEIELETLKKDTVFVSRVDEYKTPISIYRCLYLEIVKGEKVYILFNGSWFKVERDFLKIINEDIAQINESELEFPKVKKWQKESDKGPKDVIEYEDVYNERASKELDCLLLDKKCIKSKMTTSFEICDLLTKKGQVIHVKHGKTGSSGLSHLFAQGYVSAEAMLSDDEIRNIARDKIKEVEIECNKEGYYYKMVPTKSRKFQSNKYEIVYLILGYEKVGKIVYNLPFFSKINLYRINKTLTQKGYKLSIAGVGYEDN